VTEQRLEARVHGRVQGVGFRYFVLGHARELGLVGWVANEADGSVRVVAEGPVPAVDELVSRLHEGPPSSGVDRVVEERGPATGSFPEFRIRSGAHRGD
jgi:acylphosphatase